MSIREAQCWVVQGWKWHFQNVDADKEFPLDMMPPPKSIQSFDRQMSVSRQPIPETFLIAIRMIDKFIVEWILSHLHYDAT